MTTFAGSTLHVVDALSRDASLTLLSSILFFCQICISRNGDYLNTVNHRRNMKSFDVTAGKTIEVGEQIYISYNMCDNCGGRADNFGTPGTSIIVSLSNACAVCCFVCWGFLLCRVHRAWFRTTCELTLIIFSSSFSFLP